MGIQKKLETFAHLIMNLDALLVAFIVASVTLLGTTIAFLVLWRIAVEDGDAIRDLVKECEDTKDTLSNRLEECEAT